ncbi:hypothetical protein ZWY2020_023718 [Hordeum vulgare]|nr:hypothetical protein ZWY2020_023718 [Hordeum vulgare]
MLASFLRCFPNIEMLHIESLLADERTRKHNAMFWRELCPIECLKSHVTELIVHEFRGEARGSSSSLSAGARTRFGVCSSGPPQ